MMSARMLKLQEMGNFLGSAIDKLSLWFGAAAAISIVLMMITMLTDALGRKFVGAVPGAYETTAGLMALVNLLPQAYGEKHRAHVAVDVFSSRFRVRTRSIIKGIGALLGVVIFGILAWLGVVQAWISTMSGEMQVGVIFYPIWPWRWAVPLGAGLFSLQLLKTAIYEFRGGDTSARSESH